MNSEKLTTWVTIVLVVLAFAWYIYTGKKADASCQSVYGKASYATMLAPNSARVCVNPATGTFHPLPR